MKKTAIISFISIVFFNICALAYAYKTEDVTVKNKLFSVTVPDVLKDRFNVEISDDNISIYDKVLVDKGFSGFAFGIKAYKEPSAYVSFPETKKIGELTDKKGVLYDIVLRRPTDVQYDFTTKHQLPSETYRFLYDLGNVVKVQGTNGSKYFKNQGTKGKDLYKNILEKHISGINEKWDSEKLKKENMSYIYSVLSERSKDPVREIGFRFYDINNDGIDELLIGEKDENKKLIHIYDMYTMINRVPAHVMSEGRKIKYFMCNDTVICSEYSSGTKVNGTDITILIGNSAELFPLLRFKYDSSADKKNPWFISHGNNTTKNKWDNISEKEYIKRKNSYYHYENFYFIPLTEAEDKLQSLTDRYNPEKEYFDYSSVLSEFPKDYYYTTVKINKSKERILIITDKVTNNKNAYHGFFYYISENGFVHPLGFLESSKPFSKSKNYIYIRAKSGTQKICISDLKPEIIKSDTEKIKETTEKIQFDTIKSADKFEGDYGEPAGDDVVKAQIDGFYFEYHKPQYKRKIIEGLMKECINDGVKTNVQMYSCMVKKLHP